MNSEEEYLCYYCSGSGEGQAEGMVCGWCHGSGISEQINDEEE